MKFKSIPFYFVRHAETDHNVNKVYEDLTDVSINDHGVMQAERLSQVLSFIPIRTICSSPLQRVQQTKQIAFKDRKFQDILVDGLRECSGALWRLFLAREKRVLSSQEEELISEFVSRVQETLSYCLEQESPLLILAHGGIYWAIAHLLDLEGDRKADNCQLLHIMPHEDRWKVEKVTEKPQIEFFYEQPTSFKGTLEVSTVFMQWENKILFLQRGKNCLSPNTWAIPGGKLEKDETPLEGLKRELWEELRLRPQHQNDLGYVRTCYVRHPMAEYKLHLYRWNLKSLPVIQINYNLSFGFFRHLDCVKAPGTNDRRQVHIEFNIDLPSIIRPREL